MMLDPLPESIQCAIEFLPVVKRERGIMPVFGLFKKLFQRSGSPESEEVDLFYGHGLNLIHPFLYLGKIIEATFLFSEAREKSTPDGSGILTSKAGIDKCEPGFFQPFSCLIEKPNGVKVMYGVKCQNEVQFIVGQLQIFGVYTLGQEIFMAMIPQIKFGFVYHGLIDITADKVKPRKIL